MIGLKNKRKTLEKLMINDTKTGFGLVSIILHWVMAFSIIGLFVLGLLMVELNYYDPLYKILPNLHKSIGLILAILWFIRLYWRIRSVNPDDSEQTSDWQKKVAKSVHTVLYFLMFNIFLSGYLISTGKGEGITVFNWFEISALPFNFDNQEDLAGMIHLYLALSLIVLVVFHSLAALKHHFVDKNDSFKRMLIVRRNI